jgi:hypothetical protein
MDVRAASVGLLVLTAAWLVIGRVKRHLVKSALRKRGVARRRQLDDELVAARRALPPRPTPEREAQVGRRCLSTPRSAERGARTGASRALHRTRSTTHCKTVDGRCRQPPALRSGVRARGPHPRCVFVSKGGIA